ncbi:MAG: allantoate deiminase [Tissierellia bacterium]|nr:allantoate deiminase [Tissierellia bacterium]
MQIREQIEYYQKIFSSFGALEGGGITRLLYTDQWYEALKRLELEIKKVGFKSEFDNVGNLFGIIEGYSNEFVSTGSHIDSVVEGGNLDGQFGIVAGLIAIQNLVKKYGKPQKTFQLVALAEEEGSRFPTVFWGSKNVMGIAKKQDVINIKDKNGKKFTDEMKRLGFKFKEENDRRNLGKFVEIHIEQGNLLENLNKPIGVITAITGQKRYDVKIQGQANHAGTTRMCYRKDAIYAYSCIVKEAIEKAVETDDLLVCTFGRVNIIPNTVNVVPGVCEFSIDCRHPDKKILAEFSKWLERRMDEIAIKHKVDIDYKLWMDQEPVPMDKEMIDLIEKSVKELEFDYEIMHSGAGHDSQIFAEFVPTGMIFVPSIGGISHNIHEKTDISDLEKGIKVLEKTLYKLAY